MSMAKFSVITVLLLKLLRPGMSLSQLILANLGIGLAVMVFEDLDRLISSDRVKS